MASGPATKPHQSPDPKQGARNRGILVMDPADSLGGARTAVPLGEEDQLLPAAIQRTAEEHTRAQSRLGNVVCSYSERRCTGATIRWSEPSLTAGA